MPVRVVIGSDHAAYDIKTEMVKFLESEEMKAVVSSVIDIGPANADRVDYPDYAEKGCAVVLAKEADFGILLCGSGIGICISANKIKGIRAALCHDNYTAKVSRQHNDANVICAGARTTGPEVIKDMIRAFLTTGFDGGRHAERVEKIHALEKSNQ